MDFAENNDEFYIFNLIHAKTSALITGVGGTLAVVMLTIAGLALFQWEFYDHSIRILALCGFLIFLVSGTIIHLLVLYGVHVNRTRYLSPFSPYHLFLIALNTITSLIAIGEIVSDQHPSRLNYSAHAKGMLFALPVATVIQVAMMYSVSRCRTYIRKRARWTRMGRRPRVREVLETSSIFHTKSSISPVATLSVSELDENLINSPGPSHK